MKLWKRTAPALGRNPVLDLAIAAPTQFNRIDGVSIQRGPLRYGGGA
jgi:hypothetical protein